MSLKSVKQVFYDTGNYIQKDSVPGVYGIYPKWKILLGAELRKPTRNKSVFAKQSGISQEHICSINIILPRKFINQYQVMP